jgi:hypothetical protein
VHNPLVSDDLDEVALLLAQFPLEIRSSMRNRLIEASERRDDLVGGLLGFAGIAVSMASMLRLGWRHTEPNEIRRLYQRAAGVGRDRAIADTAVVSDRLAPLAAAPNAPQGDELLLSAAKRLVHWVADGQPDDGTMSEPEAAFARLAEAWDRDEHPPDLIAELTNSYIEAWAATLQA